jgi:hypothetical protein
MLNTPPKPHKKRLNESNRRDSKAPRKKGGSPKTAAPTLDE